MEPQPLRSEVKLAIVFGKGALCAMRYINASCKIR